MSNHTVTLDVIKAAMALAERDVELGLASAEEILALPRSRFAPAERKRIAELLSIEGKSLREIAAHTGASKSTIADDLSETGQNSSGSGRRKKKKRGRRMEHPGITLQSLTNTWELTAPDIRAAFIQHLRETGEIQ